MAAMCCDARARDLAAWSPATETLRLFSSSGRSKDYAHTTPSSFQYILYPTHSAAPFISESIHHTAALTPP